MTYPWFLHDMEKAGPIKKAGAMRQLHPNGYLEPEL
jgi:hypothetical protein